MRLKFTVSWNVYLYIDECLTCKWYTCSLHANINPLFDIWCSATTNGKKNSSQAESVTFTSTPEARLTAPEAIAVRTAAAAAAARGGWTLIFRRLGEHTGGASRPLVALNHSIYSCPASSSVWESWSGSRPSATPPPLAPPPPPPPPGRYHCTVPTVINTSRTKWRAGSLGGNVSRRDTPDIYSTYNRTPTRIPSFYLPWENLNCPPTLL